MVSALDYESMKMKAPRNFVILYYGREGSSPVIKELARCHDVIVPVFEDFDRYACPELAEANIPAILDQMLTTGRFSQDIAADPLMNAADGMVGKAVGFKWRIWGDAEAIGAMLKKHKVVVFELMRRDVINLALSLYMTKFVLPEAENAPFAELRRDPHPQFQLRWLDPQAQKEFQDFVRTLEFDVDLEDFATIVDNYVTERNDIRNTYVKTFAQQGIETHALFYEDYERDSRSFMRRISDITRIPTEADAAGFYKKVNRADIRPQVINLAEVLSLPAVKDAVSRYKMLIGHKTTEQSPDRTETLNEAVEKNLYRRVGRTISDLFAVRSSEWAKATKQPTNYSRISFVIPAYNAQATLGRTLLSIIAQKVDWWEAVVVDDGSSDDTFEIAKKWATANPRIKAVRQPNAGPSIARNRGLEEAACEWVAFVDADDTIDTNYLRKLFAVLDANPEADAVCSGYIRVDASGAPTATYKSPRLDKDPEAVCMKSCPTSIHGIIVRRKIVLDVGGFDETLLTNEDWDLWIRLARAGTKFAFYDGELAYYWSSDASLTKNSARMLRDSGEVRARALKPDPRIAHIATAHHEASTDGESVALAQLGSALWNSGMAIGEGRNAISALEAIDFPEDIPDYRDWFMNSLLDGLVVGAQTQTHALLPRWPQMEAPAKEFVHKFEEKAKQPGLAYALLKALQRDLIRLSRFRGTKALSSTMGAMISLRVLSQDLTIPDAIDTIVFRIPWLRPRSRFMFDVPVFGDLSAHEVRLIVFNQLGHLFSIVVMRFWLTRNVARRMARWTALTRRILPRRARRDKRPQSAQHAAAGIIALDEASGTDMAALETCHASPRRDIRGKTYFESQRKVSSGDFTGVDNKSVAEGERRKLAYKIPVLMYHRVATDGPEALAQYRISPEKFAHQLQFLRRRGFRSVSVEEWAACSDRSGALPGRPILLTFDDAYLDFYEAAWPIIRDSGFSAHVFAVTDKVATAADWDARFGPPAPLMDWNQIRELSRHGIGFGSHLASHTRADYLTSGALLTEAIRSRRALARALETDICTIALPFGVSDRRVEQILEIAGYERSFLTDGGFASVCGPTMRTPRIEVCGKGDIDTFANKLGLWRERPEAADLP